MAGDDRSRKRKGKQVRSDNVRKLRARNVLSEIPLNMPARHSRIFKTLATPTTVDVENIPPITESLNFEVDYSPLSVVGGTATQPSQIPISRRRSMHSMPHEIVRRLDFGHTAIGGYGYCTTANPSPSDQMHIDLNFPPGDGFRPIADSFQFPLRGSTNMNPGHSVSANIPSSSRVNPSFTASSSDHRLFDLNEAYEDASAPFHGIVDDPLRCTLNLNRTTSHETNIASTSDATPSEMGLRTYHRVTFDLNEPYEGGEEGHDSDSAEVPCTEHVAPVNRTRTTRRYFESWNFGGPKCTCPECGAVMWYEERKNKRVSKTKNPRFSLCCGNGTVKLAPLQDPPPFLNELLRSNDSRAKYFRKHIRSFNSITAFTSTGGRVDNSSNDGRGPPVFKIHGQIYHRIGSLIPVRGQKAKFAQLYIIDTDHELENRVAAMTEHGDNLDPEILQGLIHMLDQFNPYAQAFRKVRDRFAASDYAPVRLKLIGTRSRDARQYNLPTASEVASLLVDGEEDSSSNRDVIIETQTGLLRSISELHPCYMPMQYPLIFPRGEDGYNTDIVARGPKGNKKMSQREFYCYRLMYRKDQGNNVLMCGRLSQQYAIDGWHCVRGERAAWASRNQPKLRHNVVQGLEDAANRGDTDASSVGSRIILPASFTGGPRYMTRCYQDSMAICRWAGPPDLFLTFTCNSQWPEIKAYVEEFFPGQETAERIEAIDRVFKIKLDQLIDDITKGEHFGKAIGVVYTVEFQKRGLPHAHIALFLHQSCKIKDTATVDSMISAELPDEHEDPVAYKTVRQFMLHGPCGNANRSAPCMDEGTCTKHFPKAFNAVTTLSADGFPVYRRRNDGRAANVRGVQLDNRWVVPHNVDLLVKYNAHINVEVCNQTKCIKYLFKYMCKGDDRATAVIQQDATTNESGESNGITCNEITRYLNCTYTSCSEAEWRLFQFPIQFRHPTVERLSIHLPNQQSVIYSDGDDIRDVLNRPHIHSTMLTGWFAANRTYASARSLTFAQFPEHWVWDKKTKKWKPRKKGFAIGRLYYVHPSVGERYYLRVLLNIVKGARSFEDLRSVNGRVYGTFREACAALGLLDGDQEWNQTLLEASFTATGHQLRELWVIILEYCQVVDESTFWMNNRDLLSEDMLHRQRQLHQRVDLVISQDELYNLTLIEIEKIMNKNGSSLRNHENLPFPTSIPTHDQNNALIMEELCYNRLQLLEQHAQLHRGLNADQKSVYDVVVNSVSNGLGGFFFVYGSGGTGKTYLWQTILARLRSEGKIVLAVASSGIAALLMKGGRTAHSCFKIPIDIHSKSVCNVHQGSPLANLFKSTSLIIWDEAPMAHRYSFESVDRMLRDIMRGTVPGAESKVFGGIPVLLGGDFRQILPVVPKGRRADIISASIFRSYLWEDCRVFTLSINMRLRNSTSSSTAEFMQWLLDLGDGTLPHVHGDQDESFTIRISRGFLIPNNSDSLRAIVDHTYPGIESNYKEPHFLKDRAILSATNEVVDAVNDYVLSRIPGDSRTYYSADRISPQSGDLADQELLYPTEYLNSLKLTGVPNHAIELKEGVPIILLRNINQHDGLCNGTRLIVCRMHNWVIEAEAITGRNVGRRFFIPRVEMVPSETKLPFSFSRRQFPIKVCFAMTINKSQGQTFENVGVYLPRPVFTHGQLYVAASRVTSPEGLKFLIVDDDESSKDQTDNVVFREAFHAVFHR